MAFPILTPLNPQHTHGRYNSPYRTSTNPTIQIEPSACLVDLDQLIDLGQAELSVFQTAGGLDVGIGMIWVTVGHKH